MGLLAVQLMFWPLLWFGYHDGEFNLLESLLLAGVWLRLLGAVWLAQVSPWFFFAPGALLTIYMIGKVLGWEAESPGWAGI